MGRLINIVRLEPAPRRVLLLKAFGAPGQFDETKHARAGKGNSGKYRGGEFTPKGQGGGGMAGPAPAPQMHTPEQQQAVQQHKRTLLMQQKKATTAQAQAGVARVFHSEKEHGPRLEQDHDRHFHPGQGAVEVPLDRIRSEKRGKAKGAAKQLHGGEKLSPPSARDNRDGTFTLNDGHDVHAAAQANGWHSLPVVPDGKLPTAGGVEESKAIPMEERLALVDRLMSEGAQSGGRTIPPVPREDLDEIDGYIKAWQGGKDTKGQFSVDGKGEQWTPEREAIHATIFNSPDYLGGDRGKTQPGQQPHIIFYAGAPASGKGSAFKGLCNEDDYLYLNNDDVKALLVDPNAVDDPGRSYNGKNAAIVHEESSYVEESIFAAAVAEGRNIIVDGTFKSAKKMKEIQHLKSLGYRVSGFHVAIPLQDNLTRALGRYMSGRQKQQEGKQREGGRFVPLEMIAQNYDSYQDTFDQAVQQGHFDEWVKVDNGGDGGRKIIARGHNGQQQAAE
jgi:predicted ABC-type ATPase